MLSGRPSRGHFSRVSLFVRRLAPRPSRFEGITRHSSDAAFVLCSRGMSGSSRARRSASRRPIFSVRASLGTGSRGVLMRSPFVLAAKVFLGCLFVLVLLPAGSPAGGRFPESSRPAGAAVGCGRVGWRARGAAGTRLLCLVAFAPARRERRREASWRRRRALLRVARGRTE